MLQTTRQLTIREFTYAEAVRNRLIDDRESIQRWLIEMCTECDRYLDGADDRHVMINGWVIIGCQGYMQVSPQAVGIVPQDWDDWARGDDDPLARHPNYRFCSRCLTHTRVIGRGVPVVIDLNTVPTYSLVCGHIEI